MMRKISKRKILGLSFTLAFLVSAAILGFLPSMIENETDDSNPIDLPQGIKNTPEIFSSEVSNAPWWNSSFEYRRLLNVTNPYSWDVDDYGAVFTFDYSTLVSESKMQSDLEDIRIVEDGVAREYFYLKNYPTQGQATIWFKTDVAADSTEQDTFLYYGNSSVGKNDSIYINELFGTDWWSFEDYDENGGATGYDVFRDLIDDDNDEHNLASGSSNDAEVPVEFDGIDSKITSGPSHDGAGSKSLFFDGSNDYLALNKSYADDDFESGFTICAWIKTYEVGQQGDYYIASYDRSELWRFAMGSDRMNDGEISLHPNADDEGNPTEVNDGTWRFIAATYSYNGIQQYNVYVEDVDGELNKWTDNDPRGMDNAQYYGFISAGSESHGPNYAVDAQHTPDSNWYGWMDDIRMYLGKVLTDSELEWVYNLSAAPIDVDLNEEQAQEPRVNITARDVNGLPIQNANITLYDGDDGSYVASGLTGEDGTYLFSDLGSAPVRVNFTVTLSSNVISLTETINSTSTAIEFNEVYEEFTIWCSASTHILNITDVDSVAVDNAWVFFGNETVPQIYNSSANSTGFARFTWVNDTTSGYNYNYTIQYEDNDFLKPDSPLDLATGTFTDHTDTSRDVSVNLTTVIFTCYEFADPSKKITNVELDINWNVSGGGSIDITEDTFVTDASGKATLRWLNTYAMTQELGVGNYTLEVFFGGQKSFYRNGTGPLSITNLTFTTATDYNISIDANPEYYQTELIDLNPKTDLDIVWGSKLRFRVLFNATLYENSNNQTQYPTQLGPTTGYLSYEISDLSISGTLYPDSDMGTGYYYGEIDTKALNIPLDDNYQIEITAVKPQYQSPDPLVITFDVNPNEMLLNQSQNNESLIETYWDEDVDMSVSAYGQYDELLLIEDTILINESNSFQFSIPDAENVWNLTEITFDISNYAGIGGSAEQRLYITDPWGKLHTFDQNDGLNYFGDGDTRSVWTDVAIPSEDLNDFIEENDFNFIFNGTFSGTINITAEAKFVRHKVEIQMTHLNITDSINVTYGGNGWAMKNITFNIFNCKDTSDWSDVDPGNVNLQIRAHQNFTATDRFTYSMTTSALGTGKIVIDNITLYPLNDLFSFSVISDDPNIMFDVNLSIDYIQYFYEYYNLDNATVTKSEDGVAKLGTFQIDPNDPGWDDNQDAQLFIIDVNNGTEFFIPTEIEMVVEIGGQNYTVTEEGAIFISEISNFNKDTLYDAIIYTNRSETIYFSIEYQIDYTRTLYEDLRNEVSSVTYDVGDLAGTVSYDSINEYYIQTINTTALNVRTYTVDFSVEKQYYATASIGLDLQILARPTIVNNSIDTSFSPQLYIWQAKNFTLEYKDTRRDTRVSGCEIIYYNWWKLDSNGNRLQTAGNYGLSVNNITETQDALYILDFDTENKAVGQYEIAAHIRKEKYEEQIVYFSLTINKRVIQVTPIFQFEADFGENLQFSVTLKDSFSELPLTNATVTLIIDGTLYPFTETGNGIYQLSISTSEMDAFFADKTLSCSFRVQKEDYVTVSQDFNVIVNMQEIFEGVPLFYFILGVAITATVISAVAIYRYVQLAKIPEFVKKTRKIKKEIKAQETISEENLYPSKKEFIAEQYADEWKELGLSIEDSLGLEKKGGKKLSKNLPSEGGAQ